MSIEDRPLLPFGPFSAAFEPGELNVPGYLTLLHMDGSDCRVVIQRIRKALHANDAREFIVKLLSDSNWRPHLVSAVAVMLSKDPGEFSSALWSAVDTGSWVAPQLIATLALTDPEFVANAKHHIELRCPVSVSVDLSPLKRHSATGPAGIQHRSAKNLAALAALLGRIPASAAWLQSEIAHAEVTHLLEADRDSSGLIAQGWLDALSGQFAALDIALPRPAV